MTQSPGEPARPSRTGVLAADTLVAAVETDPMFAWVEVAPARG